MVLHLQFLLPLAKAELESVSSAGVQALRLDHVTDVRTAAQALVLQSAGSWSGCRRWRCQCYRTGDAVQLSLLLQSLLPAAAGVTVSTAWMHAWMGY